MATFQPPVVNDVPTVLPDPHPGNALFRHYGLRPRGRTVMKVAGVYATYDYPYQGTVDLATEVYLGGHVYTVTQAVADALTAAGYTVT